MTDSLVLSRWQKRRDLIIDLLIGLGIPGLGMCLRTCVPLAPLSSSLISLPLDYVVQGHRANIIQGLGCTFTVYNTTLAFPLFWMWPSVLSLIAITYGMLSLRAYVKRQRMVAELLNCKASVLNCNASVLEADHHFRFMCFSGAELTIAFPLGLFVLLNQAINEPVFPWISWEDTHSNFDRIGQYPAIFITSDRSNMIQWGVLLWAYPSLSYLFFIFFGLGRERVNQYKRWLYALLKPFGIKPSAPVPDPYSTTNRRTWWQKLLRRPASPPPLPCMAPVLDITAMKADAYCHMDSRSPSPHETY